MKYFIVSFTQKKERTQLLHYVFLTIFCYFISIIGNPSSLYAQLTLGTGVVNSYQAVSAVSGTTITLSGLPSGAVHTLLAGERVLLVQMTGLTSANGGKFEYGTVASTTATSITLTAPVTRTYSPATEKVQVLWVPANPIGIIVPAGGIVAKKWDGTTGGIVSILTSGILTLNGTINADGAGFRYADGLNTINGNDIYYGGGGASNNIGGGGGGGGYGAPGKAGLSAYGDGYDGAFYGGQSRINGYAGGGGGAGVGGAGSGGGSSPHGSGGGGGAGYSTGGDGGTGADSEPAGGLGSAGNSDTDGAVTPQSYSGYLFGGAHTAGGGGANRYVGGGGGAVQTGYSATIGGKAGSNGGSGGVSAFPAYNGGNGGGSTPIAHNNYQYCDNAFNCPNPRIWMAGAGQLTTQGGGIVLINANTIAANSKTISADGDAGIRLSNFSASGGGGGGGGGMVVVNTQKITAAPLTLCAKGGQGAKGTSDGVHGGGGGGSGGGGLVWIQDPLGGVGRNNLTGVPPAVPNITFCVDGGPMAIIAANGKSATFSGVGGEGGSGSIQANNPCAIFGKENCVCTGPIAHATAKTQSICMGATAAAYTATPATGVGYKWYGPLADTTTAAFGASLATSAAYTPTGAALTTVGTKYYAVIVNDTNSPACSDTAFVQLVVNPLPIANAGSDVTLTCASPNVTLTATGGGTYLWSNNKTTASITETPSTTTTYNVTVTGVGGCTATDAVVATVNNPLSTNIVGTNPTCANSDGRLNLTVTGATGTPTFSWSNGATTEDLTNITAGTYTVTVTNGGCSTIGNATISVVSTNTIYERCPSNVFELTIQDNTLTGIQWKKNGVNIVGANGLTYNATTAGIYSYTSNGVGGCAVGQCCPIEIRDSGNCCNPHICLPVKVVRN